MHGIFFSGSIIAPDDVMSLGIMLFSLNICSAVQDVAVDGLALQVLLDDQLSLGNTLQVRNYNNQEVVPLQLPFLLTLPLLSNSFCHHRP